MSGDVHSNPGPWLNVSFSSTSFSTSTENIDLSNHISFIHHVQCSNITSKINSIFTEVNNFDILAFSETWLDKDITSDELKIDSFSLPERKDRADGYGGVIIYVKNHLYYKRRNDLKINGVECIWIEILTSNKHILFGSIYRPPNTNALQHSIILDSTSPCL